MAIKDSLTIHPEGKIDIHHRSEKYEKAFALLEQDGLVIPENRSLISTFLKDCFLGKAVAGRGKKKIGVARCLKYLGMLKQLSEWFGKPFSVVSNADMESFVKRLESGGIRAKNGRQFSEATKGDIKKTIKKFWKWKDGNNRAYPELVEWIDTTVSMKEVSALTRREVEALIDAAANTRDKALIMVLFDSGARAEELLNVRLKKEHVYWKDEIGCFMIRLEFSKTKPRTVSLPLSETYLKRWLEVHPAKGNPDAQLFPMAYAAMKMTVWRLGNKVLGKRVTPHMLRHSSATYYANRLKSPYKMCYRYGWTMASKEVNRYVDREGILETETAETVKADETTKVVRENQRLREELVELRDSQGELQGKFDSLNKEMAELRNGKGIMRLILSALEKEGIGQGDFAELGKLRLQALLPEVQSTDGR